MNSTIKLKNNIKMKDSGVDWIGDIPNSWLLLNNRAVLSFANNGKNLTNDTVVLSLTISGVKIKKDLNFGKSTNSYIGHQIVKPGNLVFTPRDFDQTPILSGVSDHYGCISNLYFVLNSKKDACNEFVNYYWWGIKYGVDYFNQFSYGMRSSFNRSQFNSIPFLRPPKEEQEKVVDFLDEKTENISLLIKKKKKMIELLKEKRSSIITHAVTKGLDPNVEMKDSGVDYIGRIPSSWEFKKTSQVFTKIGSGTTPSSGSVDYYNNGGEYWVQSGDLNADILRDTKKKITQKAVLECSALRFYEKDSIVIAMYGASVGNLSLIKINATTNQACCVLPRTEKINSKFAFYYYLISKDTLISLGQGGSQPNINKELIKSFKILLPSKEIQKEIVKYLDKKTSEIDSIISKIEKQIKLLGEHKASLIYHAVTGKMQEQIQ